MYHQHTQTQCFDQKDDGKEDVQPLQNATENAEKKTQLQKYQHKFNEFWVFFVYQSVSLEQLFTDRDIINVQ